MYRPKITIAWYIHNLVANLHYNPTWKEKEWSCFFRVIKNPDGEGRKVVDVYFPKQSNSKALTTITQDGNKEFFDRVVDNHPDQMGEWFGWMHSHNSMNAFRSGTDDKMRDDLGEQGGYPWLSIVTATGGGQNVHQHPLGVVYYNGTFDIYKPGRSEYDCDIFVEESPITNDQEAMLIAQKYDDKLKTIIDKYSVAEQTPKEELVSMLKNLFNTSDDSIEPDFKLNAMAMEKEIGFVESQRKSELLELTKASLNTKRTVPGGSVEYDANHFIQQLRNAESTGFGRKGKKKENENFGTYGKNSNEYTIADVTLGSIWSNSFNSSIEYEVTGINGSSATLVHTVNNQVLTLNTDILLKYYKKLEFVDVDLTEPDIFDEDYEEYLIEGWQWRSKFNSELKYEITRSDSLSTALKNLSTGAVFTTSTENITNRYEPITMDELNEPQDLPDHDAEQVPVEIGDRVVHNTTRLVYTIKYLGETHTELINDITKQEIRLDNDVFSIYYSYYDDGQ